jgi:hypothetical protein
MNLIDIKEKVISLLGAEVKPLTSGVGAGGVPEPEITPGTPVIVCIPPVGTVWPGPGTGIHCGTSQQVGSFGSGTKVQPVGIVGNLAHLKHITKLTNAFQREYLFM